MQCTIEELATLCHEANAAICRAAGDNSQKPWDEAEEWQREAARAFVRRVVIACEPLDGRESHEVWMADKLKDGWVYGPEKDGGKKTHPCLVPYDELPFEQRIKDIVIGALVFNVSALGSILPG